MNCGTTPKNHLGKRNVAHAVDLVVVNEDEGAGQEVGRETDVDGVQAGIALNNDQLVVLKRRGIHFGTSPLKATKM